jgi:hypothetical protein
MPNAEAESAGPRRLKPAILTGRIYGTTEEAAEKPGLPKRQQLPRLKPALILRCAEGPLFHGSAGAPVTFSAASEVVPFPFVAGRVVFARNRRGRFGLRVTSVTTDREAILTE